MEPTIQPPKTNRKKIAALVVATIALLAVIITATVITLRSAEQKNSDSTHSDTPKKVTREEADAQYKAGRDQQASGDLASAKTSLQKAKDSYEQLGDTSEAAEVASLLQLVKNQKRPAEPTKTEAPASQSE